MAKTILFTFENDIQRNKFLSQIRDIVTERMQPATADTKLILEKLDDVRLDPPVKTDTERVVALFVSGKKMIEGQLSDVQRRFSQETASHSASVEIRELRGGEWKVIRSRKHQK